MLVVADHVGQVLVQGAAQLHVEDLAAAADGQHGQVGAQGGGQQRPLAGVAVLVHAVDLGFGLLAVGPGVDVAAPGEDEPVEDGDHLVGGGAGALGGGAGRGQQEGTAAGGGHQLEVVVGQTAARRCQRPQLASTT